MIMSYSIKDLNKLVESNDFGEFRDKNNRFINLWEKIYSRRKDLWLTQKELWELAWIPQNKISQLESGSYWEPWFDIIWKLSKWLDISFDYLFNDSIARKTVEIYNLVLSKLESVPDIMQYMKIPFFIDLEMVKNIWKQVTNFEYIRWDYWPFDKKVYDYQKLFSFQYEHRIEDLKYVYLSDEEKNIIDSVLLEIPKEDWEKLKLLSYEIWPLKKLWVKLWDSKYMWKILELEKE